MIITCAVFSPACSDDSVVALAVVAIGAVEIANRAKIEYNTFFMLMLLGINDLLQSYAFRLETMQNRPQNNLTTASAKFLKISPHFNYNLTTW